MVIICMSKETSYKVQGKKLSNVVSIATIINTFSHMVVYAHITMYIKACVAFNKADCSHQEDHPANLHICGFCPLKVNR